MSERIGIDLGCSQMCVALCSNHPQTRIVKDPPGFGNITIPAVVSFDEDGQILIGEEAAQRCTKETQFSHVHAVQLLGRRRNDPVVQDIANQVPFEIVETGEGLVMHDPDGRSISALEAVVRLLSEARRIASEESQADVTQAVLTVPSSFNDQQRVAIKAAAQAAGLNPLRIINSATAAAIGHNLETIVCNQKDEGFALVLDLGGSTCHLDVLGIEDGIYEILASSSSSQVGGSSPHASLRVL